MKPLLSHPLRATILISNTQYAFNTLTIIIFPVTLELIDTSYNKMKECNDQPLIDGRVRIYSFCLQLAAEEHVPLCSFLSIESYHELQSYTL